MCPRSHSKVLWSLELPDLSLTACHVASPTNALSGPYHTPDFCS